MTCKHLKALYETCREHHLRFSSSDLIRIMCPECDVEEVCPSVLCDEYTDRHKGGSLPHKEREPPLASCENGGLPT